MLIAFRYIWPKLSVKCNCKKSFVQYLDENGLPQQQLPQRIVYTRLAAIECQNIMQKSSARDKTLIYLVAQFSHAIYSNTSYWRQSVSLKYPLMFYRGNPVAQSKKNVKPQELLNNYALHSEM